MLLAGLALLGLGTVMVYSASANLGAPGEWVNRQEVRHIGYAVVSAMLMFALWRIDYRWLVASRAGFAAVTVGLIVSLGLALAVMVPGWGVEINGARRWFRLGSGPHSLTFQPSELVKLASIVFLACWLGRPRDDARRFLRSLVGILVVLLSVGAVVTEDFSVAVVIGMTTVAVLILAGVRWYYLTLLIAPSAAAVYFLIVQMPARWARITAFLDPWDQANPSSYHARQGLIAIGSGGLWGKGLGNGTLKLGFLPEDSTDFIFAVICEELGFFGAALVLGLIAVILVLSWRTAGRAEDRAGKLLAGGLGVLIVLQALLHVAVNIGSAPPTGTCLPLVSAGGTALVLGAAALALIVSVSARRGTSSPWDCRQTGRQDPAT